MVNKLNSLCYIQKFTHRYIQVDLNVLRVYSLAVCGIANKSKINTRTYGVVILIIAAASKQFRKR